MHLNKLVTILSILLLSLFSMGQQQDGSVLEQRISIHQKQQTLDFIFEQISWQAGVYFSYDASILDANKKYTLEANNKSLYTILHQILNPDSYQLTELENQIIITKKQASKSTVTLKNDSIQPQYLFLSGKLIDEKKERPIPYASVSVYNKPIGTISNTDGEFLLKLHPDNIRDTVIISSMGYAQISIPAYKLLDEDLFILKPVLIRIREVKITATNAKQLLQNIRNNLPKNYSKSSKLVTSFYRETVKQDDSYISVSEAVMEILKAPYISSSRSDLVRLLKGRKSPDVQPFKWLNFKLQGGPFTITQLDAVKVRENFIDEKYEELYHYEIAKTIWYNKHPVYVLRFHPISAAFFPSFAGQLYVHRETFAIIHAEYGLNKSGLYKAKDIMIRKKPRKVKANPSYVQYKVSYQQYQGKWHLATAQASVKFKIKSKRDKLNSEFHSVSDLLITDIQPTELKRFTKDEKFTLHDIFVEELGKYDSEYWENYNIIKPNEDLRKAFKNASVN